MYGLLLLIAGLMAFPLLFPEETALWLRKALQWLEARRARQEHETASLEQVLTINQEWAAWIAALRQNLPRTHTPAHRRQLLTQALAAGQRYLQNLNRGEFPHLYTKTETICQHLEEELKDATKQKKGRSLATPPLNPSA